MMQQIEAVYIALDRAIRRGSMIQRESNRDKEFHFQEWFRARLEEATISYVVGGRNSYPDFTLTDSSEGFEIKGLAYPGRETTFDANSQIPKGQYNGKTIYYVFGRYPKSPGKNEYPVLDLVICHGDLLNADRNYQHQNKSIRGFGSYGDILIRDRKMYVIPTPFALIRHTKHRRTLILPKAMTVRDERLHPVSNFRRTEGADMLYAYEFNLESNELQPKTKTKSSPLVEHWFTAYRYVEDAASTEEFVL